MKKIFTLFAAAAALTFGSINSASAQVEQGTVIIDPYYGYPNFGKKFADGIVGDSATNVDITGIGPCGLRGEYMISDNFGVGVDFIYNSLGVKYNYEDWDTLGITHTYEDKINQQRIRVQLRMNYHFAQTEQVDAYVGFGAGTSIRRFSYSSDNPNFTEPDAVSGALIPVSLRLALGVRYYFTDFLGINAEIGLGGPMISGGISLKF